MSFACSGTAATHRNKLSEDATRGFRVKESRCVDRSGYGCVDQIPIFPLAEAEFLAEDFFAVLSDAGRGARGCRRTYD